MSYARTSFGPGNIGNLTSGIGLTYGPTIGSNDSRTQINTGFSGLGGCSGLGSPMLPASTLALDRLLRPTSAKRSQIVQEKKKAMVFDDVADLVDDSDGATQLIDDQAVYTEEPVVEEPQVTQSAIPAWFWVTGGLGLLAAIGGVAWYVMKK